MAGNKKKRTELTRLVTQTFLTKIHASEDGILNFKLTHRSLPLRYRRKVYDVKNVLMGLGLIEKISDTYIQWKGYGPDGTTNGVSEKAKLLRRQIEKLNEHEKLLDKQFHWIKQSIKNVQDDPDNEEMFYVTKDDIKACFEDDQAVLVLKAPLGTKLGVWLEPNKDGETWRHLHVKSEKRMQALLIEKEKPEDSAMEETDMEVQNLLGNDISEPHSSTRLLELSPPPSKHDYSMSLRSSEGLCDLFDIPEFKQ